MNIELAQDLLDVGLNPKSFEGARFDEVLSITKSHQIIQMARDDFLKGDLTWEEYLELCEMHDLNIDSYLETVENNLATVGLII